MSQKPRRVSELVQEVGSSSTSKPPRRSRIAQPTRNLSGVRHLERTSSDSSIHPVKNLFVQTVNTKPQRSSSATPQRTPLRMKTPTRQSQVMQASSERSSNKNWIISESLRITEYLRVIEPPILENHFFKNGGIKNMSTKQFIIIVNYFLKLIAGNRLSVASNYVEVMPKILNEISYPNTVAKSWLKTPTAPHAFHNVILLFAWFLTFVPSNLEFENNYIFETKDFPNKEYACNFVRQSREVFSAWNNGSDNVLEEVKTKLANNMIQNTCNLKNLEDLESKITAIKLEDDEIKCILNEDKRCVKYNRLEADFKLKLKEVEKLEKNCSFNSKEIEDSKSQIKTKEKLLKSFEKEVKDIKSNIKNQKMNVEERNNFLTQINRLNLELKVKMDNIMQLQEEGSKNQIILSRLIHKKTALITKFNTYIHKLFTEVKLLNSFKYDEFKLNKDGEILNSFKYDEFKLNKDCGIQGFDQAGEILQKISEQLNFNTKKVEEEIQKQEHFIKKLQEQYKINFKPTLDDRDKKITDLKQRIKHIDEIITISINQKEKDIESLEVELNDLILSNDHMLKDLQKTNDKLEKLKTLNVETWNDFENEMQSIFKLKEQQLEAIFGELENFRVTMEVLRNFIPKNDD